MEIYDLGGKLKIIVRRDERKEEGKSSKIIVC